MKSKASFAITCIFSSAAVLIGTAFSINMAHNLGGVEASNFNRLKSVAAFDKPSRNISSPQANPNTVIIQPSSSTLNEQNHRNESAQSELRRLGLYTGSIDGQWGPQSRAALKDYYAKTNQEGNGWLTSGILAELKRAKKSDLNVVNTIDITNRVYEKPSSPQKIVESNQLKLDPYKILPGTWEMLTPLIDGQTGNPYDYNAIVTKVEPECGGYMYLSLNIPQFNKFPVTGKLSIYWEDTTPIANATKENYTSTTSVQIDYDESNNTVMLDPRYIDVTCLVPKSEFQLRGSRIKILKIDKKWTEGILSNSTLSFQPKKEASRNVTNLGGLYYKK